ncbi:inositol monophosphatase family protein [Holospora undulata]|uniref:Inositol-1-monophosphatase n=2 Tax=Holospora TaxID=44747 RepID=A0A061JGD8_9PROT|nr:inositol monophosphatase family protein [Holospora undulata]ETZ05030.1 inositol-1-monophosphatase [Holospora undulata HU1]GAJ46295.1 inositol-1-monophosphatase [Holospora elegans E1]
MFQVRAFSTPSSFVNVVTRLMFKASGNLLRDFSEVEKLQGAEKSLKKFVTDSECRVEKILYQGLKESYPGYGFLMEEGGGIPGESIDAATWIIDPLDGSNNFSKGIPYFSISVSLYERQDFLMGVIYDPVRDEIFWAQKGVGAFLDQYRLRLPQKRPRNYIAMALPGPRHTSDQCSRIVSLFQRFPLALFRSFGSTSLHLAYVAAGRLDGCVEYATRIWDSAAGIAILKEAGGRMSHQFKGPLQGQGVLSSDVVAAHPEIYETLYSATAVKPS